MEPLLEINQLSIRFPHAGGFHTAVNNISFAIPKGSITAVVGESGSGKSVTALSLLQLLPKSAVINGLIQFRDKEPATSLQSLSVDQITNIRGKSISMIFQEPMTSLNPLMTCGRQVDEIFQQHNYLSKKEAREKTLAIFQEVELRDPEKTYRSYPHEISGGQKQRVMIAMAIACRPLLLIADEPTTALDVRVQKSIMLLLKKIQQKNGMSILLITHDLGIVSDFADEVVVMYKGDIVETGKADTVLRHPAHAYTKGLMACRPRPDMKGKRLPILSDFLPNNKEKELTVADVSEQSPANKNSSPVIKVENLYVHFPLTKNFWGKTTSYHKAVDNVSFSVMQGETLGIVGESGCGKTTLGKALLGLVTPTSGKIIIQGKEITGNAIKPLTTNARDMQIVFQDPYGSLNPRITIGEAIGEPMKVHQLFPKAGERKEKTMDLLRSVGLSSDQFYKYPHQFSGGQRQRICIARSLALSPSMLVFDESVSALDVSVQAQVLNLIQELKEQHGFTYLFISHDLSVVHHISDRILVMQAGGIVEQGDASDVFFRPKEAYTRELLSAIPGK